MTDGFVKVDLHVHTPASSCYKGSKDDAEYYSVLSTAKSRHIRIIAADLPDGNSIP